jgi:hypothetical protein
MLSATNTITDIKTLLRNSFSFYGFADDPAFSDSLEISVNHIVLAEMYPALSSMRSSGGYDYGLELLQTNNRLTIGKSYYDTIKAKDKVGLSVTEEYIYNAELYFAMADFLYNLDNDSKYSINGSTKTISTKGYSSSVSGADKASGKQTISETYHNKAASFMSLAGNTSNSLYRGNR